MRAAGIRKLSHLDTDQIIRAQQNVVVCIEAAATRYRLKLRDRLLHQCEDPPIEALGSRTQRSVAGELRKGYTNAGLSVGDGLRRDLQSICKRDVLLLESDESFASSVRFGPGTLGIYLVAELSPAGELAGLFAVREFGQLKPALVVEAPGHFEILSDFIVVISS